MRKTSAFALGGFVCLVGLWSHADYPLSFREALFYLRVSGTVRAGAPELRLDAHFPGEWETVCGSHCYSGSIHLSQNDRTYEPVSGCSDGAWGLIFISKDGTYGSASGKCHRTGFRLLVEGCLKRQDSIIPRDHVSRWPCAQYRAPVHR